MRTYAQYCPIVRAVEMLGDRWTLLIVRDMLNGARRFNEIARGLPGLSRALLSRRLRQLQHAGLVVHAADGYLLTPPGEDLRPLVFGLADWGARHAFGNPRAEELDPEVLMWWLHGRVDTTDVVKRAVIQVEVSDRRRVYWLVLEPQDVSVCYTDPGFEIDAVLRSDIATLFRMWEGEIELLDAVRAGSISLTGARWIVRGLPAWLRLSPVAPTVRAARASGAYS
ncbi:HxlR family transcriptional regulator [Herbihabitans rhizosphaerae]|uniref:HxlR family transcriptional regulator n=1 Tax=Herbihabitans rhizosphaerae TaxID=1872711 RepID=A0A4V2ES77_9PSEU|nr:helix-turn-helix domain-containing protein [Herbihabitans rhizosphaerae]RZS36613.1 HxlR family transcriptional regulator [Herbihabitans rhizosphaerae]